MNLISIGEVLVCESGTENPYRYQGAFSSGFWRKKALQAFRDRDETFGLELWHAPAGGGARRITVDEVDWSGMGEQKKGRNAKSIALLPAITVWAWIADDGAPVVQIDTPEETEDHERIRVYVNDAKATGWSLEAALNPRDPMTGEPKAGSSS